LPKRVSKNYIARILATCTHAYYFRNSIALLAQGRDHKCPLQKALKVVKTIEIAIRRKQAGIRFRREETIIK
jgi:hypothetical protein